MELPICASQVPEEQMYLCKLGPSLHDNEFQHLCIPGKESGRGMARVDVDLIVPGALK